MTIIVMIINDKKDDDDNLLPPGQLWFPWRLEDYQGPKPLRRRAPTFVIIIIIIIIDMIINVLINDHQLDLNDHDDDQRHQNHFP